MRELRMLGSVRGALSNGVRTAINYRWRGVPKIDISGHGQFAVPTTSHHSTKIGQVIIHCSPHCHLAPRHGRACAEQSTLRLIESPQRSGKQARGRRGSNLENRYRVTSLFVTSVQ